MAGAQVNFQARSAGVVIRWLAKAGSQFEWVLVLARAPRVRRWWTHGASPRRSVETLGRLLSETAPPWPMALLFGFVSALFSFLFRYLAADLLGDSEAFLTAFPLVLVTGLLGGWVAGWCFLVCNIIGSWYLFIGEPMSFALGPHEAGILSGSFLVGVVILLICAVLRNAFKELAFAREKDRLLSRELQHRVKNTLALVQGLSRRIFLPDRPVRLALAEFEMRVVALAAAHDLVDADNEATSLDRLIEQCLTPFCGTDLAERVAASGPDVELDADAATGLFLVIHELATNATKYGALSASGGRVSVHWRLSGPTEQRLELQWREAEGPMVDEPQRVGFGSQLLDRVIVRQFKGSVARRFPTAGLEVDLSIPL